MARPVELGCGLLAIGRQWGITPRVPTESEAQQFLEAAFVAGVRLFDTAPSYGVSERRLGKFLRGLTAGERASVAVATKFGEHWDARTERPYEGHGQDDLKRSIDQSISLLGHVTLLQLHRPSPTVLYSPDFELAVHYAKDQEVDLLGISVNNVAMARTAIESAMFSSIQLPYNRSVPEFRYPIDLATCAGMQVVINRPFAMGAVMAAGSDGPSAAVAAFEFVRAPDFGGAVLTGTSNPDHLRENIVAFNSVRRTT